MLVQIWIVKSSRQQWSPPFAVVCDRQINMVLKTNTFCAVISVSAITEVHCLLLKKTNQTYLSNS